MSIRGEMYIPGNSVVLQFPGGSGLEFRGNHRMMKVDDVPWTDIVGLREGPGIRFRGQAGNSNWFHFSVPTPAVVPTPSLGGHTEITVDRVSVYYRTPGDQVFISGVHVVDGTSSQAVPGVGSDHLLINDHSTAFEEGLNSWLIDPIALRLGSAHGVGISVHVTFDVEGDVFFRCAAIHYQLNE